MEVTVAEQPWRAPGAQVTREARLKAVFEDRYHSLCRLAYVILGREAGCEDIVMEAFVRTFSGLGRLRDPDRSEAYLRRAVVNLCRSGRRRGIVEERANARDWQNQRATTHIADTSTGALWEAVKLLPDRQRAAVVLRYYERLSDAEIATTLGCSVGTVRSQLFKARAKLAATLATTDSEEL